MSLLPLNTLHLTTPIADHFRVPVDFISWDEVKPLQHLIFYSRDTVTRLLEDHGFEIVRFRWCHRVTLATYQSRSATFVILA